MLQYIIVHISTSLLSLEIGACFKGLQEPEHSLKHKLILLLWMRLWLKEWVVWVMGYSPLWEQDLASGYAGAFTTWNTSTTLSVLQRSMVVAMAQNMPDLLTVSLERDTGSSCVGSDGCWPAVDHNGIVAVLRCTLYTSHCCRFEAADDMMSVTLSCDHRVVDGAVGSLLLNHFQSHF